uniref:methylenetetrahydrofolate reductase (NADPH) n=1 Tax=Parastrongyloides trichosuri TaxID=131310 RepID=A0A0N4Z4M7_PARTI
MAPNLEDKKNKEVNFNFEEYSNGLRRNDSSVVSFVDENELTTYTPLIKRINNQIETGVPFFSLEFFPPKTANGVANFINRLDRFRDGGTFFLDVTWHASSDPANLDKETSSSSIARSVLDYCRLDTMLHMTCTQYSKEQTMKHIKQCKNIGLRNILALKGDIPVDPNLPENEQPKSKYYALDMIKWIKEEYGDYFTIACSGYPLGHPDAKTYRDDLEYLKAKVDAGADFIVTQLFFEVETFENFVKDCREIGINVPILPGIMPIQGYASIKRIAELSKLLIPQSILDDLEAIKNNDEAVLKYGIDRAVKMCRRILDNKTAPSLHMYTMNREGPTREILQILGLWKHYQIKSLPWKPHGGHHPLRCKEDVRPIFWSARPKSYIFRTREWDDFPNGRWGHSSSPAFNDLKEYYMFYLKAGNKEKELKMYGDKLYSIEDIQQVFVNFLTQKPNENGIKVTSLPWNEEEKGVSFETNLIKDKLIWANQNGFLTINSQPHVNGAPSSDPIVGWGKQGGYVYQRAYLEFFTTINNVEKLIDIINTNYNERINYHAIDMTGKYEKFNYNGTNPIALTFGIFAGSEVAQPTVVDPLSFRVWKDEAFDVFNIWASIYPENSKCREILGHLHDNYILMTLVDNEYVKPTIIYDLLNETITN